MNYVKPSAIRELLRLGADPEIISFGGGYPDASLFPLEQLNEVYQRAITEKGRDSLQYTVSNGTPRLREQIARRMNLDGIDCNADNVLVLQGGQQGLDLVSKMVVDRGDIIITESPTFLGALIAFNPYEPRYIDVEMDDDGMKMDDLERVLEQNPEAKLLYTVPDFQNPSGVTMSLERRKRLIELANEYDLIVLEDSPYRELRFSGEPVPPLKSMDTEGRVIFLGSFSKILAPGLRLGWAVASHELIQQLGLLKLAADTQCSTLNMSAVSLYLDTYDIDAHIASIRTAYRTKKDLMLETIRREFPASIRFTEPSGGMFTWLTFPEGFDAGAFMRQKAVPEGKVAYVPGAPFFPVNQRANHARVSYSTQSDAGIVKGIETLARLLKAAI
ncbi:PLP-dependent aminotransferase family protein [Paraburkholderia sp.]|uniref:aminotransferase-like domain-containing protein n=1 Tax=Paraburkholderia sp. TaxID=1926495 RepID=UPI003C79B863